MKHTAIILVSESALPLARSVASDLSLREHFSASEAKDPSGAELAREACSAAPGSVLLPKKGRFAETRPQLHKPVEIYTKEEIDALKMGVRRYPYEKN